MNYERSKSMPKRFSANKGTISIFYRTSCRTAESYITVWSRTWNTWACSNILTYFCLSSAISPALKIIKSNLLHKKWFIIIIRTWSSISQHFCLSLQKIKNTTGLVFCILFSGTSTFFLKQLLNLIKLIHCRLSEMLLSNSEILILFTPVCRSSEEAEKTFKCVLWYCWALSLKIRLLSVQIGQHWPVNTLKDLIRYVLWKGGLDGEWSLIGRTMDWLKS